MANQQDGLEKTLAHFLPEEEKTLEFYRTKRRASGKKRNYIFDYGTSRTCDHANLRAIAKGGIVYRCMDCNWTFHIPGAYAQPIHNELIMAMFTIFNFSKEFGMDAVNEVLRTPIGQSDGTAHKPVLPEGMSAFDVMTLLEEVDVNTEDGGAKQLYKLIDEVFVDANSRARRLRELEGIDPHRRPEFPKEIADAYDPDMPSLQEATINSLQDGSQE